MKTAHAADSTHQQTLPSPTCPGYAPVFHKGVGNINFYGILFLLWTHLRELWWDRVYSRSKEKLETSFLFFFRQFSVYRLFDAKIPAVKKGRSPRLKY